MRNATAPTPHGPRLSKETNPVLFVVPETGVLVE
jgi:hypothetical protein